MELFTLLPDGAGPPRPHHPPPVRLHHRRIARARPSRHGPARKLRTRPEDVSHAIWRNGKGILIAKVRGAASIRAFLAHPHALRAIRNFNLTHMNRGRNAYQASHCYSLADVMLGD